MASKTQKQKQQEKEICLAILHQAKMVAEAFEVDLNQPLVSQVGHLGKYYQEWVHQPIVSKDIPRFFANDFLERLTRTAWWVVPLIWLPVVCWSASMSLQMGGNMSQVALNMVLGSFIWTFLEYILHRFLFHMTTESYWGNVTHYLLHGFHHKHPMDQSRLVYPPAAVATFCVPFWYAAKLLAVPSAAPAFFAGGLFGYVMYDCTHYYLHHGRPSTEVGRNLKIKHFNHHFKIQNAGFGVTSSLWDNVFGTVSEAKTN